MKLHVFNPEHDIALAADVDHFTAPHAGRQLRSDLGFIPAFWASDGDGVLVEDVETAQEAVRHVRQYAADVVFLTLKDLEEMASSIESVEVWGWDRSLRHQLLKSAPSLGPLMPNDTRLAFIREASNRRFAARHLLTCLLALSDQLTGQAEYMTDIKALYERMVLPCVLKAPWSSSGRGVRYVGHPGDSNVEGWIRNVIARQGGIMIEPYYPKVKDFGMEFMAMPDGSIHYMGLSWFDTVNGAYTGNLLATENDKRNLLLQYFDDCLINKVKCRIIKILHDLLKGNYVGPFGVDMMILSAADGKRFLLHPCVELNLRRTMGHVALSMSPTPAEPQRLMRIDYAGRYYLRVSEKS